MDRGAWAAPVHGAAESQTRLKRLTHAHSALFLSYAEYIMRNAGLEETQAGIKIAGRNINNLIYALRQTQRSPEGPRHLHRIPRLSEAPWQVP